MRSLLNCIGSGPIQVFFVSYRSPNGRKTIRVIDGFSRPETYSNEHRCTENCCADTGALEAVSRFKDRDTELQVSTSLPVAANHPQRRKHRLKESLQAFEVDTILHICDWTCLDFRQLKSF